MPDNNNVNHKQVIFLISLLLLQSFYCCNYTEVAAAQSTPEVYVGVDVAFKSLPLTLQLIDNVSDYTNFFVIGCHGDYNLTKLNIISQYAYSKGLHFVVYTNLPNYPPQQWLESAQNRWGNKFMSIYAYDEPGGRQIDLLEYPSVKTAANCTDAAQEFVHSVNWLLRSNTSYSITHYFDSPNQFPLFTSDYALYWYDYQAGYDTVFAEVGFNSSRQIPIALVRGAATVCNKDWGIIIDWTYSQPPYIESGQQLYADMVQAYRSGAKYIVIFDSNKDYTENILEQEHLDAMQQFWQYLQSTPSNPPSTINRAAFVLPEGFGSGFRGTTEKLWGVWKNESLAETVYTNLNHSLEQYGANLDIVYPNDWPTIESVGYGRVINWNGAIIADAPPPTLPASTPPYAPADFSSVYFYLAGGVLFAVAVLVLIKVRRTASVSFTTFRHD